MDKNTPRRMIRALLETSESNSNREKIRNTPKKPQTRLGSSPRTLVSTSSGSLQRVSLQPTSALKRPAQELLSKASKRSKSFATPSDTITPRTTIKTFLKAANTETPLEKPSIQREEAKVENLPPRQSRRESPRHPRSSISDIQRLVGSSSSSNTSVKKTSGESSRRRSGRNQSVSTPSDTITPRANIKTFLRAAETEQPTEIRAIPVNENTGTLQPEHESSRESLVEDHTLSNVLQEEPDVSEAPIGDSTIEEPTESIENAEIPGTPQDEIIFEMFDVSDRNNSTRRGVEWSKLRTPVLPDETIVKASPALVARPPIPSQQPKSRNVKKVQKKRSQAGKTNKKENDARFSLSLVKGIFEHYSALKVSKDAFDVIQSRALAPIARNVRHLRSMFRQYKNKLILSVDRRRISVDISDAFFEQLSLDLTTYCKHAKRKIIEQADVELLMRRQGLVYSRESYHALIEKYLPMEYRQEIIPIAMVGNKVYPKQR